MDSSRFDGRVPDVLLKPPGTSNLPPAPEHAQRVLEREPRQAPNTQLRGEGKNRHHHADQQPGEGKDEGRADSSASHGSSVAGFVSVTWDPMSITPPSDTIRSIVAGPHPG